MPPTLDELLKYARDVCPPPPPAPPPTVCGSDFGWELLMKQDPISMDAILHLEVQCGQTLVGEVLEPCARFQAWNATLDPEMESSRVEIATSMGVNPCLPVPELHVADGLLVCSVWFIMAALMGRELKRK